MLKNLAFLCTLSLFTFQASAQKKNPQHVLKTSNDSLSYALGMDLASTLEQFGLTEINYDIMIKGVQDQMAKKATLDMENARMHIQQELLKLASAKAQQEKEKSLKFLEENQKKDGVITTASGLQYKILKEGNGEKPTSTDVVVVHYHGTLIDGTVFDSSVERGETVEFPLNQVIPGWTEGLQLMSVGSKYVFYLPEYLAYGERAIGNIPAYSTLIFEVELFEVKKQ
ncbi:MAG TPA: FKBP-type peptidyl-prolyl cis-trans isomerase [Flavobacteriales bacterium]